MQKIKTFSGTENRKLVSEKEWLEARLADGMITATTTRIMALK